MLSKKLYLAIRKLQRLFIISGLRAKYYRRHQDFNKIILLNKINVKRSLDIGSGPNPKNPFNASTVYGVDIRSYDINESVKKCNLGFDQIPFESKYFDSVTAFDVLEHIPRIGGGVGDVSFPFINAVNEVWRILKVGGVFYSKTPCFPMSEAFQDPTHINIMTEDTIRLYFCDNAWARIYGFVGSFKLLDEGWVGGHYFCLIQKTSDIPINEINSIQINDNK
jgi:SAM-dependent methyltransferase